METFKTIPGWNEYQVSDSGNVKSLKWGKERILKLSRQDNGYVGVYLQKDHKRKFFRVHRLVALTFNEYPLDSELIVMHRNDIKHDNRLENLSIGTQSENVQDCLLKNRFYRPVGSKARSAKLNETDVPIIRSRYKQGETKRKISIDYGVHESIIGKIINGKTWTHV